MKFNVSKCKVMHTGSSNSNYLYSMNGQILNEVAEHKDVGITISGDLKVANHSARVQQSQYDAGLDQAYNQAQEYHSHGTTIQKLG